MKKALSLILVLVLCLGLCACGTDELDVKNAIAETPSHIIDDVKENRARAIQKTYLFNCSVNEITEEYFTCNNNMHIYLSNSELVKLNKNDTVAIIGKITKVEEVDSNTGTRSMIISFGKAKLYEGEVPEITYRAYEIFTGTIISKTENPYGKYDFRIFVDGDEALIYFVESENVNSLKEGDTITFTASISGIKDLSGNYTSIGAYQNAKILEH